MKPNEIVHDESLSIEERMAKLRALIETLSSEEDVFSARRQLDVLKRMQLIRERQAKQAEIQRTTPNLSVVGEMGDGMYLLSLDGGEWGRVVDTRRGVAYPQERLYSLLKNGPWRELEKPINPYFIAALVNWEAEHTPRSSR